MLKKQFNKAVIVITILLVGVFFGLVTASKADANTNQVVPQPKPFEMKLKNWAQEEWNEIKEFQKQGWEDGKAQLAQNKQQIVNLFNKAKNLLTNSNENANQ